MTDAAAPYDTISEQLRARRPADGALVGVYLDEAGRILLTAEVSEGTHHLDELFLRHLVTTVSDLNVAGVVFAVARATGRPIRRDKVLWRELNTRLAGGQTALLDLLVVGTDQHWSAATGRLSARGPDG